MKKIIFALVTATACALPSMAEGKPRNFQSSLPAESNGRCSLHGRQRDIKNDEEDTKFVDGVAIPDRLGVKASYGKWKAK